MAAKNPTDDSKSDNHDSGRNALFVVGEIVLHAQHNSKSAQLSTMEALDNQPDLGLTNLPSKRDSKKQPDPTVQKPPTPDELKLWVDELWKQDGGLSEFPYSVVSSSSFDGSSLVHVYLNNQRQTEKDEETDLAVKDRELRAALNLLNKPKKSIPINGREIIFGSAVPNWCLAGCGHSITDPGPGAFPKPVDNCDVISHPRRHEFPTTKVDDFITSRIRKNASLRVSQNNQPAPEDVNVVIFDTLPPDLDLEAAAKKFPENDLLRRLKNRWKSKQFIFKSAKDLGIELPPDLTQAADGDYHGYTHQGMYNMSDHGLFIAGVISDYVPADHMNIYLVETQNNYGVGTITTLARGIEELIKGNVIPPERMKYPLIVNCSLCVSFRMLQELRDAGLDVSMLEGDLDTLNLDNKHPEEVDNVREFRSLLDPLKELENKFSEGGVRIIAAAGNDSIEGDTPLPARYPAAFSFVLGVGSIEKGGGRNFYSNKADAPPGVGLMVFGGKAKPGGAGGHNDTDEKGEGMLGLYIGDFPVLMPDGTLGKKPSTNGWAWWAGTSFATAVMSGMFARAATKGINIKRDAPNDFRKHLENNRDGLTPGIDEPFIITPQRM